MRNSIVLLSAVFLCVTGIASAQQMTADPQSRSAAAGTSIFDADEMRMVMSFNLKYAEHQEHPWEARRSVMAALLREYRPMLIGTQEGLTDQLAYLQEQLPGYEFIGISRQGSTEDEYSAIFYDTERLELLDEGTFWLSETPDEPGSMIRGAGHPRIATWGRFRLREDGREFFHFNTHLSFEPGIIERNAEVLVDQLNRIAGSGVEVLLTGDFNAPRYTHVWKSFIEAGFRDAWQMARYVDGPRFTMHDWAGLGADPGDYRIDWIMYRGPGLGEDERGPILGVAAPEGEAAAAAEEIGRPLLAQVVAYDEGGIYPSDHFPVVLTTVGDAVPETENLRVSAQEVRAGEPLSVSTTIRNTGTRGMVPVSLFVDRESTRTGWIVLDDGEEQQVAFDTRLYEPGGREVTVDLLPPVTVQVAAVPPSLSLTAFSTERYVTPGRPVPMTAEIVNTGSFVGSRIVEFRIGDRVADSTVTIVRPGEEQQVGYAYTFDSSGLYRVSVADRSEDVAVMRPVGGAWLFRRGDDPSWSEARIDEAGWERVELPQSWEQHSDYTADNVYGWYRKTFTIPAEWEGQPLMLILGQIDDADMVYLNGEKFGQTGSFPDDPGGFESRWDVVREYVIPPELVKYGQRNTFAVRVFDRFGGGGLHGGPVGMLPLQQEQALALGAER